MEQTNPKTKLSDSEKKRKMSEEEGVLHMIEFRQRSKTMSDMRYLRGRQSHGRDMSDGRKSKPGCTGNVSITQKGSEVRLMEYLQQNFRNYDCDELVPTVDESRDRCVVENQDAETQDKKRRSHKCTMSQKEGSPRPKVMLKLSKSSITDEKRQGWENRLHVLRKTKSHSNNKLYFKKARKLHSEKNVYEDQDHKLKEPKDGNDDQVKKSSVLLLPSMQSEDYKNREQRKGMTGQKHSGIYLGSRGLNPSKTAPCINQGKKIPEIKLLFRESDSENSSINSDSSHDTSDGERYTRPRAYTVTVPRRPHVRQPEDITLCVRDMITVNDGNNHDGNVSGKMSINRDGRLLQLTCKNENQPRSRSFTMSDSVTLRKIRAMLNTRHNVSMQSSQASETEMDRKDSSSMKPCLLELEELQKSQQGSDKFKFCSQDGSNDDDNITVASCNASSVPAVDDNDTSEEAVDIPELKSPYDVLSKTFQKENRGYQKRNVWFRRSQRQSLSPRKSQREVFTGSDRPRGIRGILYGIRVGMRSLLCSTTAPEETQVKQPLSSSTTAPEETQVKKPSSSRTSRGRIDTPFPKDLEEKREISGMSEPDQTRSLLISKHAKRCSAKKEKRF